MRLVTATNSSEEDNTRVKVKKFNPTMTQVNNFLPPDLQAVIDNNDLMIVDGFLIIPNLRDCPQDSLELFGTAFQLLNDKAHSLLLEDDQHRSLENQY